MYLCDIGHDEVCYESGKCPACELRDKLEYWKNEAERLSEIAEK